MARYTPSPATLEQFLSDTLSSYVINNNDGTWSILDDCNCYTVIDLNDSYICSFAYSKQHTFQSDTTWDEIIAAFNVPYKNLYLGRYVRVEDNIMNMFQTKISNLSAPDNDGDAVNKKYVDQAIDGISYNPIVEEALANLTNQLESEINRAQSSEANLLVLIDRLYQYFFDTNSDVPPTK